MWLLSRAARALSRKAMWDVTIPAVLEKLKRLHPGYRERHPVRPQETTIHTLVSTPALHRFIKSIPTEEASSNGKPDDSQEREVGGGAQEREGEEGKIEVIVEVEEEEEEEEEEKEDEDREEVDEVDEEWEQEHRGNVFRKPFFPV